MLIHIAFQACQPVKHGPVRIAGPSRQRTGRRSEYGAQGVRIRYRRALGPLRGSEAPKCRTGMTILGLLFQSADGSKLDSFYLKHMRQPNYRQNNSGLLVPCLAPLG